MEVKESQIISPIVDLGDQALDQQAIIPAFQAEKTLKQGAGENAFRSLRYLPGLPLRPDPASPFKQGESQEAKILLTAAPFAQTITYEAAVWAILDLGFQAIIAPEFGPTFKKHSYHNNLLALEVSPTAIAEIRQFAGPIVLDVAEAAIDLGTRKIGLTIDAQLQRRWLAKESESQATLSQYEDMIAAYEAKLSIR